MDYNNDRDVSIYICIFQIQVDNANVLIKFPCQYFLQWKTSNGKKVIEGTTRPTAKNSVVQFNEKLQMNTEMIYDNQQARFFKKDTVLNLNLISKSRQDQVKLIGRVNIDLAQIANTNKYNNSRAFKLSYCSVDAQLTFSAALKAKRVTNMALIDLDKSSFHDYFSFYSCASRDPRIKKDINLTDYQETSIGYGKAPPQNVIDGVNGEQRRGKPFSQTFFMLNSPKYSPNRTSQFPKTIKQNNIQGQRNNLLSDLTIRTPSKSKQVMNSRSTQLTNQIGYANLQLGSKLQEDHKVWQREKIHFRDQIDGNRNKIFDLEKKIIELCANLEDSKRHIQITERQNKQKEQIIRSLRVNQKQIGRKSLDAENQRNQTLAQKQYLHYQETIAKLQRQIQGEKKQWKSQEEIYRNQISQIEASTTRMQKQTQQLRRMWNEKKEHYQQKQRGFQVKMKEKENKLSQLNGRIDQLIKFKYQYEMLKQFNQQKQQQLKNAESNMNKLKLEVQQIHRNNYAEEIYKLKFQLSQANKNYEELLVKYNKNEEEISKYKENYVKIQTAYQIQGKNYESCNQKTIQNETMIYSLQKDNIQLKNSLSNSSKANEQLNRKYLQQFGHNSILQKKIAENQSQLCLLHADIKRLQGQKEQIILICQKLKGQVECKSRQFEQNIKRIESTIINAQQTKDKLYIVEKESLTSKINQLSLLKQQHQAQISTLSHEISELQRYNEEERTKKQGVITQLEATVSDKQQIIKMYSSEIQSLKQINSQILASLNNVSKKKKQLEETVIILQEESQKILYILQQKEVIDKQLEQITIKYQKLMQDFQNKSEQFSITIEQKQQLHKRIQENKQRINQQAKIIDEFNDAITQQSQKILSLQASLSQKTNQYYSIINQVSYTKNELLHATSAFQSCQEELNISIKQCMNLKQIIKQINERYEQHLKIEERYLNQLNLVRQEKEDMQFLINKNNSQFVDHHEELEQKIANLQNQIQKYDNQIPFLQEEKRQLTQKCLNLQFQLNRINPIHLSLQQNLSIKSIEMQKIRVQNQQKAQLLSISKAIEQNYINRIKELQQKNEKFCNQMQKEIQQRHKLQHELQQNIKSLRVIEEQKINLNDHISQLKQQMVNNQPNNKQQLYNQIVQFEDVLQIEAAKSIIQERTTPLDENHEDLIETFGFKQQYKQILETKVCNLQGQISFLQQKLSSLENSLQQVSLRNKNLQDQLNLRKTQNTYFDYPSFQRQEMAKIVEQQRNQIQKLQTDLKSKTIKGSAALQTRIKQLQTNIVELQSTFRMEIDRILSSQTNKQQLEGGLSVINQQQSQDQCFRSQKSLNSLIATPNRVKVSLDSAQYSELKEKYQKLADQKMKIQEQLDISEQEKFNLTSALNEKQIELQQALKGRLVAQFENEQIRAINQTMMSNLQSLQIQIESLRNQVSFGTSILLPNQHSVTRSEPNLSDNDLQNKDIEIEYLRSQLEKMKNRQEQLMWNMRDLEMQLQTVTENLNLLNGSSMNSVLNSSPKISIEDISQNRDVFQIAKNQQQFGYNKQKLLQSLKKNEQLKEAAHSLIKILRERQKQAVEQQKLIKDLKSNREMINSALSNLSILKMQMICKNLEPLVKDFQKIKLKVAHLQNLRQSSDKREDTLFKVLLSFQEKLKGLKVIAQKEQEGISYT